MLFTKKLQNGILIGVLSIIGILSIVAFTPAQENPWIFKENMPTARGFLSGTIVNGKIYVIGGVDNTQLNGTSLVEMYDPATGHWATMENMPEARCSHATCTYNGKIYVFGGTAPRLNSAAKNNVYEYDPQTNTWTQKADMPYAITSCATAVVNDTIYLIGGGGVYLPPDSTVMAYHPLTETWLEKTPMSTARGCLSACVVNGKIYAIGGTTQNYNVVSYKLVEVYDPATNTWTKKTDMPSGRWGLGTCVIDGKIYAVGGWRGGTVLTTNEMYDPVTDTWTKESPLQTRRFFHFLGSIEDKIYAIGGAYPNPSNKAVPLLLSSVEEYDAAAVTSIASNAPINPTSFVLYQNFPNPFNPATMINYQLPVTSDVELSIYNLLGQKMITLVSENQPAGIHNVEWDGSGFISGLYYYRIKTDQGFMQTKKLVLLK